MPAISDQDMNAMLAEESRVNYYFYYLDVKLLLAIRTIIINKLFYFFFNSYTRQNSIQIVHYMNCIRMQENTTNN